MSQALREALARRGFPAGGILEHHGTLSSTNDRLRELARGGAPEWSVVTAESQSAGRGRRQHTWASPPGNLFASVLLRPALPAERVTLLPLLAGLAVAEAVAEWGVEAALKWPNDVLAAGRKLAGVLVESASGAAGVELAIVGIGVNVLLDPARLPGPLGERTASLRSLTGSALDPQDVGGAVLSRLALWYHALRAGGSADVLQAWRQRALPWWGREIRVLSDGVMVRGRLEGIDEAGALLLKSLDGELLRVVSGEDVRLAAGT